MAIPKLTSKDLNSILHNAQGSIEQMRSDVEHIKSSTIEKMNVLKNEQEYAMNELGKLTKLISDSQDSNRLRGIKNKIVFGGNENLLGIFDQYGSTVHKKFLRTPVNVFNIMTMNGPMFRDNVDVSINEEIREKYKHMLMHTASAEKGIVFSEYNSPNLKLKIEVDRSNLLGDTNFNVIEIDPFLSGSFNITKMRVFDINRDITNNDPEYEVKDIKKVGPSRFILDRKYELLKIEMDIELLYKNSVGKYPFGIKHLYFLNADFNPDSHLIGKIEKNNFVETISDKIFLRDQFGIRETTATEENIKMYLSESNGILEYELETSKNQVMNSIARNTRSFYVHIPLQYSAMVSIEFDNIETR